jgi:putative FmdB family regulatory protein
MPVYSFVCPKCGLVFEQRLSFKNANSSIGCPNCQNVVKKLISKPAIIFKGQGFYVTDNRPVSKSKK